jgi:hypothetical protein
MWYSCLAEMFETIDMLIWIRRVRDTPTTEIVQIALDPESGEMIGLASGMSM